MSSATRTTIMSIYKYNRLTMEEELNLFIELLGDN
jgi:hypothetical protein